MTRQVRRRTRRHGARQHQTHRKRSLLGGRYWGGRVCFAPRVAIESRLAVSRKRTFHLPSIRFQRPGCSPAGLRHRRLLGLSAHTNELSSWLTSVHSRAGMHPTALSPLLMTRPPASRSRSLSAAARHLHPPSIALITRDRKSIDIA